MEYIFDQQLPYVDGIVMGGAGKVRMYASKKFLCQVEFACKPFNDLFWGLWMLFAKYLMGRQKAARKREPGE